MTSLIEQAAQRLEQLRQAGVNIPELEALGASADTADKAAKPLAPIAPWAPPPTAVAAVAPPEERAAHHGEPTDDASFISRKVDLDLAAVAATGLLTPNAPRSHLADQYRVLKRPLISNATGKGAATVAHGNLIMVTSALPGEGKSFTSINLAMSIAAELDHTVMLVDADVARPSVLRMLGLPPGPGLLDLLEGKADMASVLIRTNVDKLTLLPSGTPHPRATELLASEAMNQLLDDMATRYPDRIIIFDSPPLLLTTESRVLASHMGQIVVVVAAGHTLQASVQQALATIEHCPLKMMLLNKAQAQLAGGYGYGYGGYGEGYGFGYGSQPQPVNQGGA
jgi:exopolysaccharide/PEP-CTERM locus tyrosine autokinase